MITVTMTNPCTDRQVQFHIATVVRDACLQAALTGYENASISGLCREGAWEAAISAIHMIDLDRVMDSPSTQPDTIKR